MSHVARISPYASTTSSETSGSRVSRMRAKSWSGYTRLVLDFDKNNALLSASTTFESWK